MRGNLDRADVPPYMERLSGGVFLSPDIFLRSSRMAESKAKTAEKGREVERRRLCPTCGSDSRVVQFTGFGPQGFFWVCEKNCGYTERT